MKYYLSSYRIGNEASIQKLKRLLPEDNRVAYISNALDPSTDHERRQASEAKDISELESLDLEVIPLDLKKYFGDTRALRNDFDSFNMVYVRGGNVFALRQAMKLSGFDELIKQKAKTNDNFLYSGYSAGICVLSPSLKGCELVDDPNQMPYPQLQSVVWDGLGLIDYAIAPHYRSDHPESDMIEKVAQFYEANNIPYKTLRDGEAIIIE